MLTIGLLINYITKSNKNGCSYLQRAAAFYACLRFWVVKISPNTFAAWRSVSSRACKYLSVVFNCECPSLAPTAFMLMPLDNASVADVWRRAWNFLCGKLCLFRKSEKISVGDVAYIIWPLLWINIQSAPFHEEPSCNLLSNCSFFHWRLFNEAH